MWLFNTCDPSLTFLSVKRCSGQVRERQQPGPADGQRHVTHVYVYQGAQAIIGPIACPAYADS
jgi:hypothetical protein